MPWTTNPKVNIVIVVPGFFMEQNNSQDVEKEITHKLQCHQGAFLKGKVQIENNIMSKSSLITWDKNTFPIGITSAELTLC